MSLSRGAGSISFLMLLYERPIRRYQASKIGS
jgi:hypothetical protein